MDTAFILQLVVNGIVLGTIYALLSMGLALIFGVIEVVNFAHGEFYMLGATAMAAAIGVAGFAYWPSVAAVVALMAIAGLLTYDLLLVRRAASIISGWSAY